MMKKLLAFLLVLVCFCVCSEGGEFDLRHNLATKTVYYQQEDYADYTPVPGTCSLVHINLVARHGTRYPTGGGVKILSQLQDALEKYGSAIKNPAFGWMKTWVNPFLEEEAGYLAVRGEIDHYNIAQRFRSSNIYQDLLQYKYAPSRYPFTSSAVPRAGRSANSFAYGLFEDRGSVGPHKFNPYFIPTNNKTVDYELRFFATCPKYMSEVSKNKSANSESDKFIAEKFPSIADSISSFLQIDKSVWNITNDQVTALWNACQYQFSISNDSSQFCALFLNDAAMVETLQYAEDLTSYWIKGYGRKINYDIACPLMQNYWDAIKAVIDGPPQGADDYSLRSTLRFAHAETIFPFVSLLGLFKDAYPLLANASNDEIQNRKWRGNIIATYAANVAINLYNCTTGAQWRVKLLHSEKEYQIPGCSEMYCPLSEFQQLYRDPIENCNFYKMCDITPCATKSNGDDDDSDWDISDYPVIIIIASVFVIGIILGVAVGAFIVVLCRKKESAPYHVLEDF